MRRGAQPPAPSICAGQAHHEQELHQCAARPDLCSGQPAGYAAHQPFSHAITPAAWGDTRPTSAAANASARSGGTAGAASALAGTVRSGRAWNWSQSTGAVATPDAAETAITPASACGTGYPSNILRRRGTITKMAPTAAKESWKPG